MISGPKSIRGRLHRAHFVGTLFALGALALLAPAAQAAPEATSTYAPKTFFGEGGSGPGQFSEPSQIASEPNSGNLLVADTANGRVQVFATDASGAPTYIGDLGTGTVARPVGVAVDRGTGAIYVSDSGVGEVFRFTSDGAPTPTYTLDATFTSPTLASYASTLAVDPTTHDLIVADSGSQEVRRFDIADGSQISAFNGSTSAGGSFTSLRNVAVDSTGTIFVVDEAYRGSVYEFEQGRLERFDAAGNPLGQLQGITEVGAVAIDPSSDGALVGGATSYFTSPRRLAIYEHTDSPVLSVNFPSSIAGGLVSVAASDTGRVWVLTETLFGFSGQTGIQPFKPADIPAAELGPISAIDATTAHVTGSVAPGTLSGAGTAHFEYSLDGDNWTSTPDQTGIAGPGSPAVSADLTDLRPNTAYSVRLSIANDDFSARSPAATFTTTAVAPAAELLPVSDRTAAAVVLNGRVNPFGQQTTYRFEYGATASYGSSAPAGAAGAAGKGYEFRTVSAAVSGLAASTTYHYRLVAENGTGTIASADATFTTRPAGEPTRAYEQVTPIDKRGMTLSVIGPFQTGLDGDALLYTNRSAANLPDTASAALETSYAAVRQSNGWELRQLDVAQHLNTTPSPIFRSTIAVSEDFSHALVISRVALTPDAIDGTGSIYRRDTRTGALDLVATGMSAVELAQGIVGRYYGGTRDFSRILFVSATALTSDALPGFEHLYEWSENEGLQLISRRVDGSPSSAQYAWEAAPAVQFTSSDISSIYMGAGDGIHLLEDGTNSLISPEGPPVSLLDVSPDGRYAAYYNGSGELFRYDRETKSTQSVAMVGGLFYTLFLGMSADGSSIFWEDQSSTALYVWHEGVVRRIARSDSLNGLFRYGGTSISPNGRYFAFTSPTLGDMPYDNRNDVACTGGRNPLAPGRCNEVYLYDAEEESLRCVSCPADGSRSAGPAAIGSGLPISRQGIPAVNDEGRVFFDTPTALVAADSNGRRDVYEAQGGDLRLISPGTAPHDARLAQMSEDGRDVFFSTEEGLVGQDTDREMDIYDARIGGGIASQGAATAPVCSGTDCRATVANPTAVPAAASETVSGHALSRRSRHHRPHKKGRRHHQKAKKGHKKSKAKSKARSRAQRPTSDRNFGK